MLCPDHPVEISETGGLRFGRCQVGALREKTADDKIEASGCGRL
jgi:hypothetical protein